jgi:hypothetical protein
VLRATAITRRPHLATYDPTTGQFLNRDPAEAMTRSAHGYPGGDPINMVDPTGLWGIHIGPIKIGSDGYPLGKNPQRLVSWQQYRERSQVRSGCAGRRRPDRWDSRPHCSPGLTVLGASAGTASFYLSVGSIVASVGGAALDCRHGFSADCAASSAEAIGGAVTTEFGRVGITAARPGLRVASGILGLVFDVAAFFSPKDC